MAVYLGYIFSVFSAFIIVLLGSLNSICNLSSDDNITVVPDLNLWSQFEVLNVGSSKDQLFVIDRCFNGEPLVATLKGLNIVFRLTAQQQTNKESDSCNMDHSLSSFADDGQIEVYSSLNSTAQLMSIADIEKFNFIGEVCGDPDSFVHGRFVENQFDGVIRTKGKTYFVENYRQHSTNSIIYQFHDLSFIVAMLSNNSMINVTPNIDKILQAVSTNEDKLLQGFIFKNRRIKTFRQSATNFENSLIWPKDCSVQVVVDYSFFEQVGGLDINLTISEIEMHFKEVNRFLKRNDLNGDGELDDLQLQIQRLEIINVKPAPATGDNVDPFTYLSRFTEYVDGKGCLVILFTFVRFFSDDVKHFFFDLNQSGAWLPAPFDNRRQLCRTNTWIMSFSGYEGFKIPRAMTIARMVAHVGHLLGVDVGSEFDPVCNHCLTSPLNDWLNNVKFSDCAIKSIAETLNTEQICFPRYKIRNSKNWPSNMSVANMSVSYTEWERKRRELRKKVLDEKTLRRIRQTISDWWSAPNPWGSRIFTIEMEDLKHGLLNLGIKHRPMPIDLASIWLLTCILVLMSIMASCIATGTRY